MQIQYKTSADYIHCMLFIIPFLIFKKYRKSRLCIDFFCQFHRRGGVKNTKQTLHFISIAPSNYSNCKNIWAHNELNH